MGARKGNPSLLRDIRDRMRSGQLHAWVNRYGYIQLEDRETGERICLGSVDKEEEYGFNERTSTGATSRDVDGHAEKIRRLP